MKTFYYVYNASKGFDSAPTVRHGTHNAAIREAKRLATKQPGDTFYILRAVDSVKAEEPIAKVEPIGIEPALNGEVHQPLSYQFSGSPIDQPTKAQDFKEGDRVEATIGNTYFREGDKGTVLQNRGHNCSVQFDAPFHYGDGKWFVDFRYMKKLPPARSDDIIRVGDRVVATKTCLYFESGNFGTVVYACPQGGCFRVQFDAPHRHGDGLWYATGGIKKLP